MRTALVFEAMRTGYAIDQINNPMTVGELREMLQEYDDDTLFILSHDNGCTYGSITYPRYMEEQEGDYGTEFIEM